MADFSFDIESQFDRQELVNAVDQVKRELSFRYDFKTSPYEIELEKDVLVVTAEDDYKLKAIHEIMQAKLVARKLDLRVLDFNSPKEPAALGHVRQKIKVISVLSSEKAKEISKLVTQNFKKAKSSIQGETVRVSSASKDILQDIMQYLKEHDVGVPLQYTNFR
ncbi:MAG: YajQ family cyclic di-GMP-binding protein [Patescibacteria group bacterium]